MDQAFWYIIDNGIATEKSYPFRADNKTGKCVYVLNMKYTGFGRCASIPSGNYSKLVSAILQQPVSTAIDFSPDMISYSQGVYNGNCTDEINHGMLILGYGIDDTCNGPCNGTAFWKLKNSFGPSWGENGYIRIFKTETDGSGPCGIQLIASVPQLLN